MRVAGLVGLLLGNDCNTTWVLLINSCFGNHLASQAFTYRENEEDPYYVWIRRGPRRLPPLGRGVDGRPRPYWLAEML